MLTILKLAILAGWAFLCRHEWMAGRRRKAVIYGAVALGLLLVL